MRRLVLVVSLTGQFLIFGGDFSIVNWALPYLHQLHLPIHKYVKLVLDILKYKMAEYKLNTFVEDHQKDIYLVLNRLLIIWKNSTYFSEMRHRDLI